MHFGLWGGGSARAGGERYGDKEYYKPLAQGSEAPERHPVELYGVEGFPRNMPFVARLLQATGEKPVGPGCLGSSSVILLILWSLLDLAWARCKGRLTRGSLF